MIFLSWLTNGGSPILRHFEEFEATLEQYGFAKDHVMIVGSAVITVIGGRENNDIEFCLEKQAYNKIAWPKRVKLFFFDYLCLSKNVDLYRHRYINLGVYDQEIFDELLFNHFNGYKIAKPEIEFSYKVKKNRFKDIEDIKNIKKNAYLNNQIDSQLVYMISTRFLSKKTKYHIFFRNIVQKLLKLRIKIINNN